MADTNCSRKAFFITSGFRTILDLCLATIIIMSYVLPRQVYADDIKNVPMVISEMPDELLTNCNEFLGSHFCSQLHTMDLDKYGFMALRTFFAYRKTLSVPACKTYVDKIMSNFEKLSSGKKLSPDEIKKCDEIKKIEKEESSKPVEGADQISAGFPEDGSPTDFLYDSAPAPITPVIRQSATSSLETQMVEGLADFIVTRAKAEAAFYYQTELKESLCKDNSKYFPNTCAALNAMDQSMSLNAMGHYMQVAIRKDVRNLPIRYIQQAVFDLWSSSDEQKRELAKEVITAKFIYDCYFAWKAGLEPTDIVRGISTYSFSCKSLEGESCVGYDRSSYDLRDYLKAASLMIIAIEQVAYYVPDGNKPDQLQLRDMSSAAAKNVIGASFAIILENLMKKQHIRLYDNNLENNYQKFVRVKNAYIYMLEIIKEMDGLRKLSGNSRKMIAEELKNGKKVLNQEGVEAMNTMIAMIYRVALDSNELLNGNDIEKIGSVSKKITESYNKTKAISGLAQSVIGGDESSAMIDFLVLMSQEQYSSIKPANSITRYLPVMAELTSARSSQDFSNILEKAAAPVASYRQKAQRSMISLTSLFGVGFGGQESYVVNGTTKSNSLDYQLFAPLGIHVTGKTPKEWWHEWFSYGGIFFSLIDLGPLVSAQSQREGKGVDSKANVGFQQLFSPGIYLTMHVHGPFNIGYGFSKTPDLLKSSTGQTVTEMRQQFFVAMDLTLLPF